MHNDFAKVVFANEEFDVESIISPHRVVLPKKCPVVLPRVRRNNRRIYMMTSAHQEIDDDVLGFFRSSAAASRNCVAASALSDGIVP